MNDETSLTLGFVRGVSPDKWAERWRAVRSRVRLETVPVSHIADPQSNNTLVTIVRVPEGRKPHGAEDPGRTRHAVYLYTEKLALIVPKEHELVEQKTIDHDDLILTPLLDYPDYDPRWPTPEPWADQTYAAKDMQATLDLVEAGLGATISALPLARAVTSRRDFKVLEIAADLPATDIYAVWRIEDDSNRIQELIGVLRGRGARSSR